jgi:hypothetical protein
MFITKWEQNDYSIIATEIKLNYTMLKLIYSLTDSVPQTSQLCKRMMEKSPHTESIYITFIANTQETDRVINVIQNSCHCLAHIALLYSVVNPLLHPSSFLLLSHRVLVGSVVSSRSFKLHIRDEIFHLHLGIVSLFFLFW